MNLYRDENELRKKYEIIAGIDEAGRGPLAGPVVVAAVILDHKNPIKGLNDSKKLSEKKRKILFEQIMENTSLVSIQIISPSEIDKRNILQATLYGMEEAIFALKQKPDLCIIDGNIIPKRIADFSRSFVKGDGRFASIAAASIVAKVTRDEIMKEYHKEFPEYNFKQNKGYPTKEHLNALRKHGITPIHRRSYKPVSELTFDF